jgi:hypothetical protein
MDSLSKFVYLPFELHMPRVLFKIGVAISNRFRSYIKSLNPADSGLIEIDLVVIDKSFSFSLGWSGVSPFVSRTPNSAVLEAA